MMIYGCIKNLEQEKSAFSPMIQKGLDYLKNADISNLSPGKHVIDGDTMFAVVSDYLPENKATRRAEAHQEYIDIQYVHSGEEFLGCSFLSDKNEVLEDLLAKQDVIFYKNTVDEMNIKLAAGNYAVVYPQDVHRPGCSTGSIDKIRKVVVKIKLSNSLPKNRK